MNSEKSLSCPGPWERLLACTDGSDEGQNAVAQALSLAQACGSRLYVLQVVEIVPEFEAVAPDLRTCLEEEIRRRKVATASEAALKGVQLDYRVLHCVSPSAAILEEAEKIQPQPHHHGPLRPHRPVASVHGLRHPPGHRPEPG